MFTWALVRSAQEGHFDDKVRLDLAFALLKHARRVRPYMKMDPDGVVRDNSGAYSANHVTLACLWRASSLLPADNMTPLLEFLTDEDLQFTSQAVLQCLFYAFQHKVPPEGPDLELLQARVDVFANRLTTKEFLADWRGWRQCLAMVAYDAALALGCPRVPEYTECVLSLKHVYADGSETSLVRSVLQHVMGTMELCRPDARREINKLLAFAKANPKQMPFPHQLEEYRRETIAWAEHHSIELCTKCWKAQAEINDGDDARGRVVCCDCYESGLPEEPIA